jgi:putative hydrolase of the HAD superfamily
MIKAVLFDLDDTLYDEMDFVKGGFRAVAKYVSLVYNINENSFFVRLMSILENEGRGQTFDKALKENGLVSASIVNKLVQVYRYHEPNLLLYPDAQSTLVKLTGKYKLGLITDGNKLVQRRKIHSLGLQKFFDIVITTNSYGKKSQKPSQFPYLKALSKLKVKPNEAIYVGDNPSKDFLGARQAGLWTIRVLRGSYASLRLSKEFEADHSVKSLSEIFGLLYCFE